MERSYEGNLEKMNLVSAANYKSCKIVVAHCLHCNSDFQVVIHLV
jgi:hypothetical protein